MTRALDEGLNSGASGSSVNFFFSSFFSEVSLAFECSGSGATGGVDDDASVVTAVSFDTDFGFAHGLSEAESGLAIWGLASIKGSGCALAFS